MMVLWEKSGVMLVFAGVMPVLYHSTEKNRLFSIFQLARRIPPPKDYAVPSVALPVPSLDDPIYTLRKSSKSIRQCCVAQLEAP